MDSCSMILGVPGSKSILQRLLVLLAHSKGELCIHNYNACDDVLELEQALTVYGFRLQHRGSTAHFRFSEELHQQSEHQYRFTASATAYRLWLALLANLPGKSSQIHASETLFHRGISPLCEALNSLGAEIRMDGTSLHITGTILQGNEVAIQTGLSSQYASSLMLAAPFMQDSLSLKPDARLVSAPYLKLSAEMLRSFGAKVDLNDDHIRVQRASFTLPDEFAVDSDLSTAAYLALRAVLGDQVQELRLFLHPEYHQPDMAIWGILQEMGATIETAGNVYRIHPSALQGISLDLSDNPDLMPVLSIAALFCSSPSHFSGIGRLIHKESNRILGISKALDLLGAQYQLEYDSISIMPLVTRVPACTLDTQQDHRLVMAFSLIGMRYPQVKLSDVNSLGKSVPCAKSHNISCVGNDLA